MKSLTAVLDAVEDRLSRFFNALWSVTDRPYLLGVLLTLLVVTGFTWLCRTDTVRAVLYPTPERARYNRLFDAWVKNGGPEPSSAPLPAKNGSGTELWATDDDPPKGMKPRSFYFRQTGTQWFEYAEYTRGPLVEGAK